MIIGGGGRLLPVTAAILMLVGLSLSLALVSLRVPGKLKIDEALLSAQVAVIEGEVPMARKELLRASRYAVSASQWTHILFLTTQLLPAEPQSSDYRLFATLAGRASALIPGDQNLAAYMVWGQLRLGNEEKAMRHADSLSTVAWSSLRAEARLSAFFDGDADEIQSFYESLNFNLDAEYLEYAAQLTESAELSVDAALSYMLEGQSAKAMEVAREVMAGNRWWSDPSTPVRRDIAGVLGRIAYDTGDWNTAVRWLEAGVDEARKRRTVIWSDLHLLGDIYWEMYRLQGVAAYRDSARDAWSEAKEIATPLEPRGAPPEDSWKLWLNLAVLESLSGSSREAEELLREALVLFPERGEVKAAWARANMESNPAMARRLVAQTGETDDAVLGITSLQIDPESITPRLYEARLWELFGFAVQEDTVEVSQTDVRIIALFLLEYMASRKNYSSVDVAVDRYLKAHPQDDWILSWRLAADASRWMALINLVPKLSGEDSSYVRFRNLVRRIQSWRGLHDSALFALLAAEELTHLVQSYSESPIPGEPKYRDAAIASAVMEKGESFRLAAHPLGDRVDNLERSRVDLHSMMKELQAGGRNGRTARALAKATLTAELELLYSNALEDIDLATATVGDLKPKERAALLYLEAEILRRIGRYDEAVSLASEALAVYPSHPRAQQLLNVEVLP